MATNNYLEFSFVIKPKGDISIQNSGELLSAELGTLGFESFVENDTGIVAYIDATVFDPKILQSISTWSANLFDFEYTQKEIPQINWNEEWEKNFDAILVDGACSIRAPFHEAPNTTFDIIIEPKMSFGTGHHETTHMMVQYLLELEVSDKKILDMGCGTGVLAILASKRGGTPIDAIDIDHWCYLNTLENVERNNCSKIQVLEGDVALLEGRKYDLIIANINRNILLKDINQYAKALHPAGELIVSGFYQQDLNLVSEECANNGLKFISSKQRNNWIASYYQRKRVTPII